MTVGMSRMKNWNEWFANIPGYEYDKNHGYWQDGLIGDMYEASQHAMGVNDYEYEAFGYHRGVMKSPSEGWGKDVPDVVYDPYWFDKDKSGYDFNLGHLTEILELSRNFGVRVVGVVFPQSPNYLKTNAWGATDRRARQQKSCRLPFKNLSKNIRISRCLMSTTMAIMILKASSSSMKTTCVLMAAL